MTKKNQKNKLWWIASVTAIAGAGYILYETVFKDILSVSKVKEPNFIDKTFDFEKRTLSVIKSHSTRIINDEITNAQWFEIGRTGQYNQRSEFYKDAKMILLAKSKRREDIVELENFYQKKYEENPKIRDNSNNVRMETNDGFFYLYLVVAKTPLKYD